MQDYAVDTDIRRQTYVFLAVVALAAPAFFNSVRTIFGLPASFAIPLTASTIFGVLYTLHDQIVWRWLQSWIAVPNLNGKWMATGFSSFKDPISGEPFEFQMEVKIRQTFSKIEIFTRTGDSTSRSTMASICTQHAVPIFRYAFENMPKGLANDELQRHPGLVELGIESNDMMTGHYFSGKHRSRFGDLTLRRSKS
jgi:hypothetical protein